MFDVFQNVLAEIRKQTSDMNFKTWFVGTELVNLDEKSGVATIRTDNVFKQKTLETRYAKSFIDAFQHNNCNVTRVEIVSSSKKNTTVTPHEVPKGGDDTSPRGPSSREGRVEHIKVPTPKKKDDYSSSGLSSEYTFESFVVGTSNELAAGVAKLIAEDPGKKTNPFFLYGGPGLGKTHLVQAIGNEILRKFPKKKVLYIPTNHFYADFVAMIKVGKGEEFVKKYTSLDVLIIDDFQMIIGKEKSQEEFFNVFNDLIQAKKQIIVTSDRLPEQIKELDPRLSSRLGMGGAFDLQLPSFEDRCAILRAKAEFSGQEIEEEAIEFIANNIKTNIRDLSGEFNRIILTSEVRGMTPLELINEGYTSGSVRQRLRSLTPNLVVEKVAKYYGLTVPEMTGRSRVSNIKTARQVAMYLLSKELGMSTSKIAPEVGVKDHTTVMNGIRKIDRDQKTDSRLRDQVEQIKEAIYG